MSFTHSWSNLLFYRWVIFDEWLILDSYSGFCWFPGVFFRSLFPFSHYLYATQVYLLSGIADHLLPLGLCQLQNPGSPAFHHVCADPRIWNISSPCCIAFYLFGSIWSGPIICRHYTCMSKCEHLIDVNIGEQVVDVIFWRWCTHIFELSLWTPYIFIIYNLAKLILIIIIINWERTEIFQMWKMSF